MQESWNQKVTKYEGGFSHFHKMGKKFSVANSDWITGNVVETHDEQLSSTRHRERHDKKSDPRAVLNDHGIQ